MHPHHGPYLRKDRVMGCTPCFMICTPVYLISCLLLLIILLERSETNASFFHCTYWLRIRRERSSMKEANQSYSTSSQLPCLTRCFQAPCYHSTNGGALSSSSASRASVILSALASISVSHFPLHIDSSIYSREKGDIDDLHSPSYTYFITSSGWLIIICILTSTNLSHLKCFSAWMPPTSPEVPTPTRLFSPNPWQPWFWQELLLLPLWLASLVSVDSI